MQALTHRLIQLHFSAPKTSFSSNWIANAFFSFPYVKHKLKGQRPSTIEGAVAVFRLHILEIPQSERQKCVENWFKRMQKCEELHDEYFEKQ